MITLDTPVTIPPGAVSAAAGGDFVLLNTRTAQYYSLEDSGARLWALLKEGLPVRLAHETLLKEYEVEPQRLEEDILELLSRLAEAGMVELGPASQKPSA